MVATKRRIGVVVRGAWLSTRRWTALGTVVLATLAGGFGGAAPADAAVLRLGPLGADVNVGLSLNGGLQLKVGAKVGFNQSNWNGDDKGEQNPMSTVTGATGAQAVWTRTDSAGQKITGKGVGVAVI